MDALLVDKIHTTVTEQVALLEKFFCSGIYDTLTYYYGEDQKQYLLFLLCHDTNGNKYSKLYNPNDTSMNNKDLIFIRCNKDSLYRVLVERVHIMEEINNNFIQIGSLFTGVFYPFHDVHLDYRIIDGSNYVFQYWLRFNAFRDFIVLEFCEQVFIIAIILCLHNLNDNQINTWAVLNPQKSKLLKQSHGVGLFGIQGFSSMNDKVSMKGLKQTDRIAINDYIGKKLFDTFNSSSSHLMGIMTPLKGNIFGPVDIPLELKIDLLHKKIDDGSNTDLLDCFIDTFTPHLFSYEQSASKNYWKRDLIFSDNNDILVNGKIYGFVLNIKEADVIFPEIESLNNVTPVACVNILSQNRIIYNNLFTIGRTGEVFIPLIPIKDENDVIISFKYPSYYTDGTSIVNIKLPIIDEHTLTTFKILYVDVYNFIIGYFLHRDYLNVLGYYDINEKKLIYQSNNIKYSFRFSDDISEIQRCNSYSWIQGNNKHGKNICPIVIIILTIFFHNLQFATGTPVHLARFFNHALKMDISGAIFSNGVIFDNPKINDTDISRDESNVYAQILSRSQFYITDEYRKSGILPEHIKKYIAECDEQRNNLLRQLDDTDMDEGDDNDEVASNNSDTEDYRNDGSGENDNVRTHDNNDILSNTLVPKKVKASQKTKLNNVELDSSYDKSNLTLLSNVSGSSGIIYKKYNDASGATQITAAPVRYTTISTVVQESGNDTDELSNITNTRITRCIFLVKDNVICGRKNQLDINGYCMGHRGGIINTCKSTHVHCQKLQYHANGYCREHANDQEGFRSCGIPGCTNRKGVTDTSEYCYTHQGGELNFCKGGSIANPCLNAIQNLKGYCYKHSFLGRNDGSDNDDDDDDN